MSPTSSLIYKMPSNALWQAFLALRKKRVKVWSRYITPYLADCSFVLDVGTGDGLMAQQILSVRANLDIKGLDVDDSRVVPINLNLYDGNSFPFSENSFDAVLLLFTLHHCPNFEQIIQEARMVSRKRVLVIEDTPNIFLETLPCKMHEMEWQLLKGHKTALNFFNAREWQEIFIKNSLRVVRVEHLHNPWLLSHPVRRTLFVLEKA